MKKNGLHLLVLLCVFWTGSATAAPIFFDLTLFEDAPGSEVWMGVFTVDSADIDALPSDGRSFNPAVTSMFIGIGGIEFDIAPGGAIGTDPVRAVGIDGVIVGLTNNFGAPDPFLSSSTQGASLFFNTAGGLPFDWTARDATGSVFARGDVRDPPYSIAESPVSIPSPTTFVLVALALVLCGRHAHSTRQTPKPLGGSCIRYHSRYVPRGLEPCS